MASSASRAPTLRRRLLQATAVTAGAGVGAFAWAYHTDAGVRRSTRFWQHVAPMLARYKWAQLRSADEDDKQQRYNELHENHAPKVREMMAELGGMFVKTAQVLSVAPLPEAFRSELRKLQDSANSADWEAIRQVLEEDLGGRVEDIFESFETTPLGSASIGQAHLARFGGKQVVVKVQYPDAAEMLHADFGCLALLARIAGTAEQVAYVDEWRNRFGEELDYVQEAANLTDCHAAFQQSGNLTASVAVPSIIPELSGRRVIGMEHLPGGKLEAALRQRLQSLGVDLTWDHSKGRKSPMAQQFGGRGAQAGDTVGPASWLRQLALSALRMLGMDRVMWLTRKLVNIRLRAAALLGYASTGSSVEVSDALRVVLEAHGFQLFFCPLFNSDPHPGNILLLPDGRIGLLDFGQCRRMSHHQRADLARLFVVLGRAKQGNASDSELASAFAATGMTSAHGDDRFLSIMPRLLFDKVDAEWFDKESPVGKEWREVMKGDKLEHFPPHMSSLCRMVMLLRGQCMVLQENVSLVDIWQPFAERWLREHGEPIPTC